MPTFGGADRITIEATVDRDTVEYRQADDSVRDVAGWTHTDLAAAERGTAPEREAGYETVPFERWAQNERAGVGADRSEDAVHVGGRGEIGLGLDPISVFAADAAYGWSLPAISRSGSGSPPTNNGHERGHPASVNTAAIPPSRRHRMAGG